MRDGLLEVTERLLREAEVAVRPALLGRRGQGGVRPVTPDTRPGGWSFLIRDGQLVSTTIWVVFFHFSNTPFSIRY